MIGYFLIIDGTDLPFLIINEVFHVGIIFLKHKIHLFLIAVVYGYSIDLDCQSKF